MENYKWLKRSALLEGVSLILLVFIGLPFKYYLGMPELVKIVGPLHGLLFTVFIAFLVFHLVKGGFGFKRFIVGFIASFIPTGTFFYKAKCLKKN